MGVQQGGSPALPGQMAWDDQPWLCHVRSLSIGQTNQRHHPSINYVCEGLDLMALTPLTALHAAFVDQWSVSSQELRKRLQVATIPQA